MGIDASIALQGKLPQFDNPLASLAQVSAIQNAQQQNKLADLAYGEKQREVGESRLLGEQYKASVGADGAIDRNKLYTGLAGAGLGAKLPGIQKGFADQDKSALDATKAKLEAGLKHFEMAGQIMSGVKDQASYDLARQQAVQFLGPEAAAKMPAVYDPATIEQGRLKAMSVKEQLEQQWKALEFGQKKEEFAYRQGNDAANRDVTKSGQVITMRGQDMSQGTAIRGQDMTDERAREINDGRMEELKLKRAEQKEKPLTEFQSKATNFAARMQEADKLIASLGDKYSPSAINSKAAVEGTPIVGGMLGAITNKFALSENDQSAEQAQRDFINANLRLESGAAIGKDEFANARKQYFPQPGDTEGQIKQKSENRRLAIEGLKVGAGEGAKQIDGMVDRSKTGAVQQVKEAVKNGEVTKLANAKPVSVKSAADYAKLPSGTVYTAPDGSMRTKS